MNRQTIRISEIELDHELQSRVATDPDAIDDYAQALEAGKELPPVVVFDDGDTKWLADGYHRVPAHVKTNRQFILAYVMEGNRDAALWFAAGANSDHGVRRSNADKRRQVEMALALKPESSDRAIAEHCGVGNQLVGDVRRQVCESHTCEEPQKRVGRDGKTYTTAKTQATEPADPDEFAFLDEPEDADDFEPEAVEAGAKEHHAERNGREVVPAADAKAVLSSMGGVIRGLDSLGLYDGLRTECSAIVEALREQ